MINGFINGQDLRLSQPKIAADTIDYLEAVFKFQTADWNGLEKWAHFQKGDVVYDVMLEDDKIHKEKHLNLSAGYWSVYLHGNAFENGEMVQRITTDIARLSVEKSGVLDGDPLPLVPPSVAEQLSARIANLEESGGGSGGDGLDGLSIYTDPNKYGSTTVVSLTTINVPEGRTVQSGDLIVDGTGKVFLVTSVSGDVVYIESTGIDLKGADGNYIIPCGGNCGTGVGVITTHLIYEFHLPDGHTLRVGDRAVCANGYLATVVAISGENVTLYATGICIKGAKGDKGDTGEQGPQGPAYTLTDTDKAELVQMVIESLGGYPVFGYVDADNNIIVQGNLANGTYTVKYEMEDGSTVDIGSLVLDNNVYYSVTNTLTNCTNSNSATEVYVGGSYSATITANSGYELSSVVVTMGGTEVSVTNGVINIASVTGDIVITAVAVETAAEITNWIEKVGYAADTRLSVSSGSTTSASGYNCTDFISAKYGDELYIENIDLTDENATNICFYDSAKNRLAVNPAGNQYGTRLYYLFVTKGTQTGAGYLTTIVADGSIEALPETVEYIRIGSKSITSQSVLNIKRNGVWL